MSIRTSISRVPQQSPGSRLEQVLRIGTTYYQGNSTVQPSDEEVVRMLAELDSQPGFITFRAEHAFSKWVSKTEVHSTVNVWIGAQNGHLGPVEYNFGQIAWVRWLVNGESCGEVNMLLSENRLNELKRIVNKRREDNALYARLKFEIQEAGRKGGQMLILERYFNAEFFRHPTGRYKDFFYTINTSGVPSDFEPGRGVTLMMRPLMRQNAEIYQP